MKTKKSYNVLPLDITHDISSFRGKIEILILNVLQLYFSNSIEVFQHIENPLHAQMLLKYCHRFLLTISYQTVL